MPAPAPCRPLLAAARAVAAAALALGAACGSPPAPPEAHDPAPCDEAWLRNGYDQCEHGCADAALALGASGPACQAATAAGVGIACSKTFEVDGARGCCATEKPRVVFADCP